MDSWTISGLAREAALNVFGRGSRLVFLAAISIALGVGVSALNALDTVGFRSELAALETAGANVAMFRGVDPDSLATVTRASCEALGSSAGVDRAGILVYSARSSVFPLGNDIPTVRASTSLFAQLSSVDLVVGSSLREEADTFFVLVGESKTPASAATATKQPDAIGTDASVIMPLDVSDRLGDVCIVVLDPRYDADDESPLFGAQLYSEGGLLGYSVASAGTLHPVQRFAGRITWFGPILAGAVGGLLCGLAYRFRASELAAYRLSGTGARSMLILLWMEMGLVAGSGALAATTSGLLLTEFTLGPGATSVSSLVFGAAWMVVGGATTLPMGWRNPILLAKDR